MIETKKYFIYYNNGLFECVDKLNLTLLHMIDVGTIKIIYDPQEDKAYIKSEDGLHKDVKVGTVSGLIS